MDTMHSADRLETIDREECLRLLADADAGRIGFVVDGKPRIDPVNYIVVDGDIVLLSRPGAKLEAAVHHQVVAFEIDSLEEWAHAGWSVLAVGVASVITDPAEVAHLSAQGPHAWTSVVGGRLMRISPTELTGRRVLVAPGAVTVLRVGPSDAEQDQRP